MSCTFCTDDVRVKVPSFQKVTQILQYNIFHRDTIRLNFCLFEDIADCRDLRRISFKSFASIEIFRFRQSNNMKTNTISTLMIEIQLKACILHTKFALFCTLYYLRHGIEIFSDYSLLLAVTVLILEIVKRYKMRSNLFLKLSY